MKRSTETRLALEFIKVLRTWLTPSEMREVVKRNRRHDAEGRVGVCATHDFCDANMAMDEAFKNLKLETCFDVMERLEEEPGYEDTPAYNLANNRWNNAWDLAKACGFSGTKVRSVTKV